MLKKIILTVAVTIGLVSYTYGQGQVNFNTQVIGTSALVTDVNGWTLGSPNYGAGFKGTNFFAQLYAASGSVSSSASLSAIGNPVFFRSGSFAGYVQTADSQSGGLLPLGVSVVPTLNATLVNGGPATVQLRAWWNNGSTITNYVDAVASSNPNSRWGASQLLYLGVTGNPNAQPPGTPVDLIGLLGFQLIPEPGTVALAGLGAAALLLFRRRK